MESRNIRSFWNRDLNGFILAVRSEVLFQFLSQMTDLHADDVVVVRVEILFAPQNVATDFMFPDCGPWIRQRPLTNVKKNVLELSCPGKTPAR